MKYQIINGARVLRESGRFDEAGVLACGDRIVDVLEPRDATAIAGRDDVYETRLRRGFLIPGFVDAHFHLIALALKTSRCDLGRASGARDVVSRLSAHAATGPGDGAVVGVEWDESEWEDAAFPTRTQLDEVSGTRAVFARRICGHVGVVNSVLLARLDASSGFVDDGTGVVTEGAVARASALTRPDSSVMERGVEAAIAHLHSLGVTGIHDIIEASNVDAYAAGLRRSRLPLRIDGFFHASPDAFDALTERMSDCGGSDFLGAGVKVYLDGSLGAHTAALREPYEDGESDGTLLVGADELAVTLTACAERGITCAVHAIGDRAIAVALEQMRGVGGGRFRVEHAEIMGPEEIDLALKSGAALVMQPNFVRNWAGEGGLYQRRLGAARWRRNNPFRSLLGAGIRVAFGSDGMPPGPLYGMRGATHHPVAGERLGPLAALKLYTEAPNGVGAGAGRAAGRLEPERLCDMVHLSADPLMADLDGVEVLGTWVGGRRVYRSP